MARSEENRTNQAWKSVPEKEDQDGYTVVVGFHHFRCLDCNAIVRIDGHGWAYCEKCGLVFNDYFQDLDIRQIRDAQRAMSWAKFAKSMKLSV